MVTIVQTPELASMADAVRGVVTARSPAERVAEIADGPEAYDAPLWRTLSSDLGVTGVLVPEEHGGLGLGWPEARVVLAELGRGLACVPFLSSCVVAPAVVLGTRDEDAAAAVLPAIADGSSVVAVALGDESLFLPLPRSPVLATLAADRGWALTGATSFVADGTAADQVLLLAATEDGRHGWFLVDASTPGVTRTPMAVVDTTRPQATIELDGAHARLVGSLGACADLLVPALDAAVTGMACEQSAMCTFLLTSTVGYVSTRYQFGQPIGSFQAIQHRLADLAIHADTTVSAVEFAVWAASEAPHRFTEAASIAGFVCSEAVHLVASEAIQLHGGIGFTWEHPAHRYFRRALASRAQLGKPSYHRERLLQSLAD
jgi:alkylation response protein AidB-like acyl-CoA dehydrogenase